MYPELFFRTGDMYTLSRIMRKWRRWSRKEWRKFNSAYGIQSISTTTLFAYIPWISLDISWIFHLKSASLRYVVYWMACLTLNCYLSSCKSQNEYFRPYPSDYLLNVSIKRLMPVTMGMTDEKEMTQDEPYKDWEALNCNPYTRCMRSE